MNAPYYSFFQLLFTSIGFSFCIIVPAVFRSQLKKPLLTGFLLALVWTFIAVTIVPTIIPLGLLDVFIEGITLQQLYLIVVLVHTFIGTALTEVIIRSNWASGTNFKLSKLNIFLLITIPLIISYAINPIFDATYLDTPMGPWPSVGTFINYSIAAIFWQFLLYKFINDQKTQATIIRV